MLNSSPACLPSLTTARCLVSAILRVRSALSVMSVGVSAAAGPTYQAGAVINVHQELTALALPDANFVNVVWRALRADSVTSTQDSVHVGPVHLVSAVMVVSLDTGASQTAGRVNVMDMLTSATRGLEPVSTAEAIQPGINVTGVLMVTMETRLLV